MKKAGDIDIDMLNRDDVLKLIKHVPASIIDNNDIRKHNTGIYIQNVPTDPITGFCSIDYKEADNIGLVKIDLLNNNLYDGIKNEEHINLLLDKEINWNLLKNKETVDKLYHIHNYYDLLQTSNPQSIEELAMFIALLRPGKKHLQGKSWDIVEKDIWTKTEKFAFKKSHSFSYALSIILQMALIEENGNTDV